MSTPPPGPATATEDGSADPQAPDAFEDGYEGYADGEFPGDEDAEDREGPRAVLPPVRLAPEAELAAAALSAPVFARAVRLARWADPERPVGPAGELGDADLAEAAALLELPAEDPDTPAYAGEAWRVAVDAGLVEVTEPEEAEETGGVARPGPELPSVLGGAPRDVLDLWLAALDTVVADAAVPDLDDLVDALDEGGEIDFERLGWDPRREQEFLEGVLGNLYLLTVAEGGSGETPVPLPVLAASAVIPDGMEEPTEEVLEEVSEAMMRLDDQFRQLAGIGLVDFRPVDEALMAEATDEELAAGSPSDAELDDEDIARYGIVRLTPLGLYGVRSLLVEAGVDAPAVGDLAEEHARVLLEVVPHYPDAAADAEIDHWLAARPAPTAAAELLDAARGTDPAGPLRRLAAQRALGRLGTGADGTAETELVAAVRAGADEGESAGVARVWLAERGVDDLPPPSPELVLWLAVDTLSAHLAAVDPEEPEADGQGPVALLVELIARNPGFLDEAWRVRHPDAAAVLEAIGRLHPDRATAKEARKAAFKARSRRD
ncbi:hypothetical protein ACN20G_21220 [Streptomyces sp. BI20]|uniref:hypothetical protein n=1 Tax=Streptomyces sp. BI20 TaxID=3403460 RepID=UPI003C74E4E4